MLFQPRETTQQSEKVDSSAVVSSTVPTVGEANSAAISNSQGIYL